MELCLQNSLKGKFYIRCRQRHRESQDPFQEIKNEIFCCKSNIFIHLHNYFDFHFVCFKITIWLTLFFALQFYRFQNKQKVYELQGQGFGGSEILLIVSCPWIITIVFQQIQDFNNNYDFDTFLAVRFIPPTTFILCFCSNVFCQPTLEQLSLLKLVSKFVSLAFIAWVLENRLDYFLFWFYIFTFKQLSCPVHWIMPSSTIFPVEKWKFAFI